jgi:ABC-type nickel/cobalt efflux system permease component RcnA
MEEGHDQSRSHVRTNRKIQSPATAILMAVMSAALVVLLGLIHMKRRQIRQARNSMIRDFPSVITISNENNYYHDQAAAFSDDGPVLGDSVTQTSRGSGRRQPALEFVQLA